MCFLFQSTFTCNSFLLLQDKTASVLLLCGFCWFKQALLSKHQCRHLRPLFCDNTGRRWSWIRSSDSPHVMPFCSNQWHFSFYCVFVPSLPKYVAACLYFDLLPLEGICLPQYKRFGDNVFFVSLQAAEPSAYQSSAVLLCKMTSTDTLLWLYGAFVTTLPCYLLSIRFFLCVCILHLFFFPSFFFRRTFSASLYDKHRCCRSERSGVG